MADNVSQKDIESGLVNLSRVIKYLNDNHDNIIEAASNLNKVIDAIVKGVNHSGIKGLAKTLRNYFKQNYKKEIDNLKSVILDIYGITEGLELQRLDQAAAKLLSMGAVIAACGQLTSRISALKVNELTGKNIAGLYQLTVALRAIVFLVKDLADISVTSILLTFIKLMQMRKIIKSAAKTIKLLARIIVDPRYYIDPIAEGILYYKMSLIGKIYRIIEKVVNSIKTSGATGEWKMKFLLWRLRKIVKIILRTLHKITKLVFNRKYYVSARAILRVIIYLKLSKKLFTSFGKIIAVIREIKIPMTIRFKLWRMRLVIKSLIKTVRLLRKLGNQFRGRRKKQLLRVLILFKCLEIIFKSMKSVLITIMIIAGVGLLFIILSPIILTVLVVLFLIIKAIVVIARHIVGSPRVIIGILLLVAVMMLLKTLAMSIIALGLISIVALIALPTVVLFMLGLVGLLLVFVVFAQLAFLAVPYLTAIGAVISAITIAVLCVLVIALLLVLLQKLELDIQKIKENVKKILKTAGLIILWVTTPLYDDDTFDDNGERVNPGIFEIIGYGLQKVIGAIMGAVALLGILIAVAAIWLIALMLRSLQNINLDFGKIRDNVRLIFEISSNILDYITTPTKDRFTSSDKKDVVTALCGFVYKPLVKIVDVIIAAAYFAVLSIAILAVLLVATMLRLIQNLELDENKILNNVNMVMTISRHIIECVFNPDDENKEGSERKGVGGFLSWVLDSIGLNGLARIIEAIFALAYLAVMMIAILCLVGIAALLKVIQNMELNEEEIIKKTNTILNITRHIIACVFNPDDENQEGSERKGIGGFLSWVLRTIGLGGLASVIEAIFALAYLAVMAIAVLCLVGIAALLGIIQDFDLNEEKITSNVDTTLRTVNHIVETVFNPDDADSSQSNRRGIIGFISWVFPEIGAIMGAILTIAYLALMIIAMVIVLGLVKVMELIGKIDHSIVENAFNNVELVMLTCNNIVNKVYSGEDEGSEESNRGGLIKIVEWVAGKKVADIIGALLTIAYLALVFFAIYIVAGIAKSMETIGLIERDTILKARDNVDLVMSTAVYIMDKVMNGDYELPEAEGGGPLETLLKWLLPDDLVAIVKAIMTIGSLSFAEVMIGVLARIATNIASVGKIDTSIIDRARENATKIIKASGDILRQMSTDIAGVFDDDEFEEITKIIKGLADTVTSMASIGKSLETISKQPKFDIKRAVETTIKTYQGCLAIIEAIAQPGQKQGTTPLNDIVGAISPGHALMANATWMIFEQYEAYAKRLEALGLVVKNAGAAMKNLTNLMKSIPTLSDAMQEVQNGSKLNVDKMKKTITSIWDAINSIFVTMYNTWHDDNETWVSEGNLDDLQAVIKKISTTTKGLVNMIIAVATLFKNIRNLSTWFPLIARIDVDPKITPNIKNIFDCIFNIIKGAVDGTDIDNWDTLMYRVNKATETTQKVLGVLTSYISLMPVIQGTVDAIAGLNIDVDKIQSNAARAKESLNYMFSVIKAASIPTQNQLVRDNMDLMDRINESITSFTHVTTQDVKNSKDLTDNYIAFLTKVNSMDYTKLKTTEQLMKHWAEMSKSINGNFQGLAQAINEHIMPALNNLNKTMDESMKVQKQIIDDLSKPIDGSNIVAGSGTGETPTGGSTTTTTTTTTTTSAPESSAAHKTTKTETGAGDIYEIEENSDENLGRESKNNEPIGDSLSSFINPYGPINKRKKSPLEAALEGDVIRVKIVN